MKITARRLLAAAVSTLATAALAAPTVATAASPSPSAPAGHISGVVPVHGAKNGKPSGGSGTSGGNNLGYHGGPVMNTNTVYLIYWDPTGAGYSSSYQSTINGFFTNVAAAQNATDNVYGIDTQYYGPNAKYISNSESFSSSSTNVVVDNSAPAATTRPCTDSVTPVCVTDAQIQAEVQTVMHAKGWAPSPTSLFFVLTSSNVGSCSGSSCAFTQYCAYHSNFTPSGTSQPVYYANMPDAGIDLSACGSQQSPNGDPAADSEINVLSHEHNEAITDEGGSAWYDKRGYEIGDKCAWKFGTATGPSGAEYNQTIGSGKYYLQQEWSNKYAACELKL